MRDTILIVCQSLEKKRSLHEMLGGEYNIVDAESAACALSLLSSSDTISAVLLDNYEADTLLTKLSKDFHIPAIVLTEPNDTESALHALSMGAFDFVARPLRREILKRRIDTAVTMSKHVPLANEPEKDELTGLFTRKAFFERAETIINSAPSGSYVLSCFDIDKFKVINDQFGTASGDEVLKFAAKKIDSVISAFGGICARFTADDFALLYPRKLMDSPTLVSLLSDLSQPGKSLPPLGISIGRYIIDDLSLSVSGMYDRANIALSYVKGRFDHKIAVYDESMRTRLLAQQEIVDEMSAALEGEQFEVWLQPQYNHSSGALIGAEALVRWRHPQKGLISPNEFIPVFEQNGFIFELDKYIWEHCCALLRSWLNGGVSPLPISVNASRFDALRGDFFETITELVEKYNLPAELLRIEITESAFSGENTRLVGVVKRMIEYGFTIEIDDFGSGYSSLNTLKDVPAQILKLDMRFFEKTDNADRSGNIIESIVRMAKWLGMAVIAEGVENFAQADYLKSIGASYIQGYCYAKPMPIFDYEALLRRSAKEPELAGLSTFENLDNNEFWNPESMETLIFNSYIGGACIFEYHNGKTELLRVNDRYAKALGSLCPQGALLEELSPLPFLDESNRSKLYDCMESAIVQKKEASCELRLAKAEAIEYVRATARVIARAGERYLFYCVVENTTAAQLAEQRRRIAEQKQAEAAKQLEVIMGNINGGVSAIRIFDDGSSSFLFSNDKYYDLYGYTREQALAENLDVMSTILPEDMPDLMAKVNRLKADKKPVIIDYRIMRRDGRLAYLRTNSSLMQIGDYDDVITSVVTDITQTRVLEEQLRAIVENINGGVTATVIREGKPMFLVVNDQYFRMLGYHSREEYDAENPDKYTHIHPDDRERIIKQFESSDGGKSRYTMQYRIITRGGEVRWIRNNISIVHLFGVDEPVSLSVTNDVTNIQRAQQAERAAAEKLSMVLNHAGNGITAVVLHDDTTELLFANDKFFEIIGFSRPAYTEATKGDLLAPIHPDDRERLSKQIAGAKKQAGSTSTEFRLVRPDGKTVWIKVAITITELSDIDDPVQIGVFSDVTAEKEINEQLLFLNDSARDILAQPDAELAVGQTLKKLINYFSGDRAYVIEMDDEHSVSNNTYEQCAAGVTSEMSRLQNVPFSVSEYWFNMLRQNQYIIIDDVDELDASLPELKELLKLQGIKSIIISPLWRDGVLFGFVGIDNPREAAERIDRLRALGDHIAVLLTRRDLTRKLEQERVAMEQLINDTPGGFLRMEQRENAALAIVGMNDGFCRMLGLKRENVLLRFGNDARLCLHEDDLPSAAAAAEEAFAQNKQFSCRCRIIRSDKTILYVLLSGRFVKESDGRVFLNAYFTDITDQKKVELAQAELLDHLPCGAALYEYDGNRLSVIHINKSYWKLVGRPRADYTKESVFSVIHPEDRLIVHQEIKAAIRQNRDIEFDVRILCGKFAYKPFHIAAGITREPSGKILFSAAYTPITNAEMSLQEMLPIALSTMMSASAELSYVKDKDLRYICVSNSVADMLGFKNASELIGKSDLELFGQKLAEDFNRLDQLILDSGEAVTDYRQSVTDKNGEIRLVSSSKYPLLDTNGNVVGLYGMSRDITASSEQESQLALLTSSIAGGLASYAVHDNGISMLYFNDGFFRFSGCSREEYEKLVASDPLTFVFDEDKPLLVRMIRELRENKVDGHANGCVFRCQTKSGAIRWMSIKTVLRKVGEEKFVINVVQLDITEQKEAEQAQKELLDNLPCGAGMFEITETEISVVHINRRIAEMVGNKPNNSAPLSELIHPDDLESAQTLLHSFVRGDTDELASDLRLKTSSGIFQPFRVNARRFERADAKCACCVTFLPIPDEQLSMQQMIPYLFPAMMEASTDITFAKDKNFRYLCASHAYAQLLGLADEAELVGKTDYELFSKDVADQFRRDDKLLVNSKKPIIDKQETIPSESGLPYYTRISKYLLRDTLGNVLGIYAIGRDITERQEIHDQLKLLTETLLGGLATFACTKNENRLEYFNDGFCRLIGYEREEFAMTVNDLMNLIFEDERASVEAAIKALIANDTPIDCVYRIHTRGGGSKWVSLKAVVADRVNDSVIINAVFFDVTEQQEERERLKISEEFNRLAIAHSGNIITRFDVSTRTLTLPESFNPIFVLPHVLQNMPEEQIALGRVSEDTADDYRKLFMDIINGSASGTATYKQNSLKGWRWLEAQYTTVFAYGGKPGSAVISFTDITERLEKEVVYNKWYQSLRERSENSYTLFRCNLSKGSYYDSREGNLLKIRWSDTKLTFDELTMQYMREYVFPDDRDKYADFLNSDTLLAEYYRGHRSHILEYRELNETAEPLWRRLSVDLVEYPSSKDVEVYLMYEDIDEAKRTELLTLERSERDPLTGVLNRAAFIARVDEALSSSKRGRQHALLMLDIDNFKQVNDTLGHGAGDSVLKNLTSQIRASLRRDDLLGRLGGDEFFVFLRDIKDRESAAMKARQITEMKIPIDGSNETVTVSIGISVVPRDGRDFDTLYKKVDSALYAQKQRGKNGYLFVE